MISASDVIVYVGVVESFIGAVTFYTTYRLLIKPLLRNWKRKTKKGVIAHLDLYDETTGEFKGSVEGINISEIRDAILGTIPKDDIGSMIRHSIRQQIAKDTSEVIGQALSQKSFKKLWANKVGQIISEELGSLEDKKK